MSEFAAAARVEDVPPGSIFEAELDGESLLIVNAGGELFACDALCTHLDGPLSQGTLDDIVLRCPWYGSAFDLRSGEALNRPARTPLACFPLKVSDGEIRVSRG